VRNVSRNHRGWILACLAILWSVPGLAAHLAPTLAKEQLGVLITDARLPRTLAGDLRSGLTTRILIQIELLQQAHSMGHRDVEVDLRYDLWDDNFETTVRIDGLIVSAQTLGKLQEVTAMLAHLSIPELFPAAGLAGAKDLVMTARLLFNPLEKEQMEEIRKWVTENSRPTPNVATGSGGGLAAPQPPSESRTLFDRIFEQYAAGASVAAPFTDSATSKPFNMEALSREK
jgi:hypothetical protein